MEGDGEGMVAIVQGLDDAGMTLTVMNRPRPHSERRRSPRPKYQVNTVNTTPALNQTQRPTVETGTDVMRHTNTPFWRNSQICDDRYASSYKVAHCMVSPTVQFDDVSEFPPQRNEPCNSTRNQGNFEVGGHGSAQMSYNVRATTSRFRQFNGSQTWGERGSIHRTRSSRNTDAFIHSLRKYPVDSTISTDLIEKLIKCTQDKNCSPRRSPEKSSPSLNRQRSTETVYTDKVSKHQQTYTRRQNENGPSSTAPLGYRGRARNFKLYSPMSECRNIRETRYRGSPSTYDYLKAGSSRYGRSEGSPSPYRTTSPATTVRSERNYRSNRAVHMRSPTCSIADMSLRDISKVIRNAVRQIHNERPLVFQVCPKLKTRYSQHKKSACPLRSERTSDVANDSDQASSSVLSRLIASFSGCGMSSAVPSARLKNSKIYSNQVYSKGVQCVCNPEASTSTSHFDPKTSKSSYCVCCPDKLDKSSQEPCGCKKDSTTESVCSLEYQAYYNKKIAKEIAEWFTDVPIHSVEDPGNKTKREAMIKDLKKTIKQLTNDENFEDNAVNEIKIFIDNFPMWIPGDGKDKDKFKQRLGDNLLDRILSIPRIPYEFRDIVKKWIKDNNLENNEDVDVNTLTDNIVNELELLTANRPDCDCKFIDILSDEIFKILNKSTVNSNGNNEEIFKRLAYKLAVEIVSIPRNLSDGTTDLTSEFEDSLCDWFSELSVVAQNIDKLKRHPKSIENLAKKLNELQMQGIHDQNIVDKMREEVRKLINDVGIKVKTIDEHIEELMDQLLITVQMKEMEYLDEQELKDIIIDWLYDLPGASKLHPRVFAKVVNNLMKKIQEDIEDEIDDLENNVVDCLTEAELSIEPIDLDINIEQLREQLKMWPSREYYTEQARKDMTDDIYRIIDAAPIPIDKKEELKSRVDAIIKKNMIASAFSLGDLQGNIMESLLGDVEDVVDDVDLPQEKQLELKTQLSKSLVKNFDKSFTKLSKSKIDMKQVITKDVKNAVEELPIDEDKKKDLMQQVKGTLKKNLNKPLPDDIEDNINAEICCIVETCPARNDMSIVSLLKNKLLEVVCNVLNMFLPKRKCVCHIQWKVEKDVDVVLDKSSIDAEKKRTLKRNIQHTLSENRDRRLSDEVKKNVKDDIISAVSELSMPEDKKVVLKNLVDDTISQDFDEELNHDTNKIKNKMAKDMDNAIEELPIDRGVKKHLKSKIKPVLSRNLDSTLSIDKKNAIVDDISKVVKDTMPDDKRRSLKHKLAKKLDLKEPKSSFTDDDDHDDLISDQKMRISPADHNIEGKKGTKSKFTDSKSGEENYLSPIMEVEPIKEKDNILQGISKTIEESDLPEKKKAELRKKLEKIAADKMNMPLTDDVQDAIKDEIGDILNELPIPKAERNKLKHMIDENVNNMREEEAPETKTQKKDLRDPNNFYAQEKSTLIQPVEGKRNILQGIAKTIEESDLPEKKKAELRKKLEKIAADKMNKPFTDEVQDAIKDEIGDILKELPISKAERNKLKHMVDENVNNMREEEEPETKTQKKNLRDPKNFDVQETSPLISSLEEKHTILQGIDKIIDESPIPKERKAELKKKLNEMAADYMNKPLNYHVQHAIIDGIVDIVKQLSIPEFQKQKLKEDLIDTVNDNIKNIRAHQDLENKNHKNISRRLEKNIDEAPIPAEKTRELKQFNDMATKFYEQPTSTEFQKDDINDTRDSSPLPQEKYQKHKLKRDLYDPVDNNSNILEDRKEQNDSKRTSRAPSDEINHQPMTRDKIMKEKGVSFEEKLENAPIPEKKKAGLNTESEKETAKTFEQAMSDDDQNENDGLEELPFPRENKKEKKVIPEFNDTIVENMNTLQDEMKKIKKEKPSLPLKQTKLKQDSETDMVNSDTSDFSTEQKYIKLPETRKQEKAKDILDEFDLDPHYKKQLERNVMEELNDTARKGGDMENARKKLIAKLTRDTNLPKDEVIELADKLINSANKLKKPTISIVRDKFDANDISDEKPKDKKNITKRKLIESKDESDIPQRKNVMLRSSSSIDSLQDETTKATQLKHRFSSDTNVGLKKKKSIIENIGETVQKSKIPDKKKGKIKKELKEMLEERLTLSHLNLKDKDDKHGIREKKTVKNVLDDLDPRYKRQLEEDVMDELKELALEGGDMEVAKRKLIKKLMRDQDLSEEEATALANDMIGRAKKMAQANHDAELGIKDILDKYDIDPVYRKQLEGATMDNLKEVILKGGDIESAKRKLIKKLMRDQDLSEEEATALANEMIGRAKKMAQADRDAEMGIKDILDKYDIDPAYRKQLEGDTMDDLKDVILKGGDIEGAKRKLIKKLMRDQDLSEAKATALANEMIGRAKKMAQADRDAEMGIKDILDKYDIDPAYRKQLEGDTMDDLKDVILKGGDIDGAKRKLIKKLMRDQDLSEAEATALANEMIGRAKKMAQADRDAEMGIKDILDKYDIDPAYRKQLEGDTMDDLKDVILKGGDIEGAKRKLIKKLMRDQDLSEAEATALANEMIGRAKKMAQADRDAELGIKDILDKYDIDPAYKKQLEGDTMDDLKEVILKGGDIEGAKRKLIKKLMRDQDLSEAEATALANEMIGRAKKMAQADRDTEMGIKDILDKYDIDPAYRKQLEGDTMDDLKDVILKGGDIEGAKRKLIKKLMRDQDLSEAEATALANEMIGRAKKMAQADRDAEMGIKDILDKYDIDPAYRKQLEGDTMDDLKDVILKGGDIEGAKRKLIKKLMRDQDLSEAEATALANEMVGRAKKMAQADRDAEMGIKDILDKYYIDPAYKKQLEGDTMDDLKEVILKGGDIEGAKRKLIKKLMRDQDLSEAEATALANEMIGRAKKMAQADRDTEMGIKDILDKYDIDPAYRKQLEGDTMDDLKDVILKGGDIEGAKRKLIKKLMRDQDLSEAEATALANEMIGRAKKMAQADRDAEMGIKDILDKYDIDPAYRKQLEGDTMDDLKDVILKGGDIEGAKRKLIKKLMRDQDLSEAEATALANEMVGRAKKMAQADRDAEMGIKDILDKYDIDPAYKKQLEGDTMDDLKEVILKGGDIEGAKRKLIKKLMRDQDLSEAEATALANEMIGRAKKMAQANRDAEMGIKDILDKYDIDPAYKKQLEGDTMDDLKDVILKGGDIEGAKRKLIKKLMRDQDLSEAEATALANEMIGRAKKMAQADRDAELGIKDILDKYDIDPAYRKQLEGDTMDDLKDVILKGGDIEGAKRKLIKKLMRDQDLSEAEATALANEMIGRAKKMAQADRDAEMGIKDILDKYDIDPAYRKQLEGDTMDDLKDVILKGGDIEGAKRKLIKKLMRDQDLSEAEATALANEMVGRAKKMAQADRDAELGIKDILDKYDIDPAYRKQLEGDTMDDLKDVILKGGDIDGAKRKLIKKLMRDQNLSEEEATALANEMIGRAKEMAATDDTEYLEKLKKTIQTWMDSVPIHLNSEVKTNITDDLANDILERMKYLQVHRDATYSNKDELENLKYQVFRRFAKELDADDMPKIMGETDRLYKMIMDLKVPSHFPKLRRVSLKG